jgi:hypothetical protein
MNAIATRLQIGTAACAVAAAATLMPLQAAQAAPAIPAPDWLGTALGSTGCILPIFNATECAATHAATIGGLLYLGPVDSTPPPRVDFLHLDPTPVLALIPVIGVPLASWFNSLNIEVCVGGLSARIGSPYSSGLTASIGSHC